MEWSLAAGVWVESRAAITPERTRRRKMSIRTIIALSAAIVLSTAATASAATKKQKVPRSGPQAHAIAPRAAPHFDPYSPINPYRPEATGGGTPGYNQMLERY
jgi:hypothetical protein